MKKHKAQARAACMTNFSRLAEESVGACLCWPYPGVDMRSLSSSCRCCRTASSRRTPENSSCRRWLRATDSSSLDKNNCFVTRGKTIQTSEVMVHYVIFFLHWWHLAKSLQTVGTWRKMFCIIVDGFSYEVRPGYKQERLFLSVFTIVTCKGLWRCLQTVTQSYFHICYEDSLE